MAIRIEVSAADDPDARRVVEAAPLVGVSRLSDCRRSRVFHIEADLDPPDLQRLCTEVLVDPVLDTFVIGPAATTEARVIEVALRAGVTDTDARQLEQGAAELGLGPIRVSVARRFELFGELTDRDVAVITDRLLVNRVIERHGHGALAPEPPVAARVDVRVHEVAIAGLDGDELVALSRCRSLALDATEMIAIQAHFDREGRAPTDAELETLAQTWSEHCVHKTFRARVELTHTAADGTVIVTHHDGLLDALREVTEELDPWWLRSAFVDNAGIVAFDEELDLAFKVETHNHPSALEPFGGANTGVGGVVRDVIGVSARPIACTDVLCFGPVDVPDAEVPPGVLHPRRVRDGVVAGIGDYGNKLGLPTVNGAVIHNPGYTANPLVYCGALGLLPTGSHPTSPQPGDRIVSIGGRTGRDGIHGATFSSAGMDASTAAASGSAVQIGDPITEKGCIEVVERARDRGLYTAITDCGAGGFSSAVGEMAADSGAEVDLAGVRLKYPGLLPWEIWLSEAQERMVLAVPPTNLHELGALCEDWEVELIDLGELTDSGRLVVRHEATIVVDLPMELLHHGLPRRDLGAVWAEPGGGSTPGSRSSELALSNTEPAAVLLRLLAHPDVASKEEIVRTFDHEVRGGAVVRPFVGPRCDGPADAAVLKPLGTWHHHRAVVLAVGINPRIGRVDPWAMALHCIDEAVRNLVAVGGDPDRVALLDNFCWGDPTEPDRLGSLVRAVQGCVEGARRYAMPFVSGKDSLFNEFDGVPVPGTLLISALAILPDLRRTVTSALPEVGEDLWLVGSGSRALGGSLLAEVLGLHRTDVPAPVDDPLPRYRAVHRLVAAGVITAAHDCSEGGVGVALAEMAIAGRRGISVVLPDDDSDPVTVLTNEAPGRIVVAAPRRHRARMSDELGPLGGRIGEVTGDDRIVLCVGRADARGEGLDRPATTRIELDLAAVVAAFSGTPLHESGR